MAARSGPPAEIMSYQQRGPQEMNANWREKVLDEVMGFIMDTHDVGQVADLELIQQEFPQVKDDLQLQAEIELLLGMHHWFADPVRDWQETATTEDVAE